MSRASNPPRSWSAFAFVCAAGLLLTATAAHATHFRFGHLTWKRVSGTTVQFTFTQAWRSTSVGQLSINFGDASGSGIAPYTTIGTFTDLAGEGYTITQYTLQHTYPSDGPYVASGASCCRISSLINAGDDPERVETVVDLRNGNTGSPVSSVPVIVQLAQGGLRTFPLPVTDPDGDTLSCRMATSAESQIPTVATAGGHTLSVTPGCVLTWDTSGTAVGQKYAVQVAIEEDHAGNVSRVALDFIIEIIGFVGQAPACSGTSGNTVLNVGQPFVGNFTGTDADGDALTISHLGLPPGATLTPPSGTNAPQPFNATFNWTPALADAGSAHAVSIVYTDPIGLQGVCSFSLRVTQCGDGIIDPLAGEECEDGNATACDGCTNCHIDRCGDGVLCAPEQCDDGNLTPGDGCDASCIVEPFCGDGNVDPGETCDDGNAVDCDGCSGCQIDTCGDGRVCAPEACDDNNGVACDGCTACQIDTCGDGTVCPPEECDDGNIAPGDGCSDICTNEQRCGNGIVEPPEPCDDGNQNFGDGCRPDCTAELCGDGILDPQEGCDDGGTAPGFCGTLSHPSPDTCSSVCELLMCKDPARIRFRTGKPDAFSGHGKLEPITEDFDPAGHEVGIKLENANGPIFVALLPPGSLESSGKSFKHVDRFARRDGRSSEGVMMVKVTNKGSWAAFTFKAYGDLSAATDPSMKLTVRVGGEIFAIAADWRQVGSGWILSPKVIPAQ